MDKEALEVAKGIFYMGTIVAFGYGIYTAFVSLI